MSAPENPTPTPNSDSQTLSEMRAAIESLRGAFQVVALSGIALSCTLMLFFYREVKTIRRQNDDYKAFITDYNTNVLPKVEMSRTNLEAFARTNPTFIPLYKKYFATNAAATNPAPPGLRRQANKPPQTRDTALGSSPNRQLQLARD